MGLRGSIGFLLVVAIAFAISSYTFYHLTDYDQGKSFFSETIKDKILEESTAQDIKKAEEDTKNKCVGKGSVEIDITKEPLTINCSQLYTNTFETVLANSIYDHIYYKRYNCKFFDCFESTGTFSALIAQQNHKRYWVYYLYLLAIIAILAVLLFFVSEDWIEKTSSFGYVLLISGLGALPYIVTQMIFSQTSQFFKDVFYAQLIMLFIGVGLLVLKSILVKNKRQTIEDKWEQLHEKSKEENKDVKDNSKE